LNSLREKIEEAWWKVVANNDLGLKLMPTPKEHKNLIGGKEQYLDATLDAIKAHIKECESPPVRHVDRKQWHDDVAYMSLCQLHPRQDFRKALMDSRE